MSRFSFAVDPGFVAHNRFGTDPVARPMDTLSFFSWTMLSAVTLAAGMASLIWFG